MSHTNIDSLTLKNDFLFCTVFTMYPELLKKLLFYITGKKVKEIIGLEKQKVMDFEVETKAVRLDVYFEGDGEIYHIEMQQSQKWNVPKRMRYYQAMSDMDQLQKGAMYDTLKKTYVIFICDYDLFGAGLFQYTFVNRCEENREIEFGDETVKIILNTKGKQGIIPEELQNFLTYLSKGLKQSEFINEIDEAVIRVKHNPEWRRRYMTLEENAKMIVYMEKEKYIAQGEKKGLKEGRLEGEKKGLKQGRLEVYETFVEQLKKEHKTEEEIKGELKRFFSLTDEEIESILESN